MNQLLESNNRIRMDKEHICLICGNRINVNKAINFDHKIPVVRGGPDDKCNKIITHVNCNSNKAFLTLAEYKVIINHMDYGEFLYKRNKVSRLIGKYKKSRPDVSDLEFNKVIRFFLELNFPCLIQYNEEEQKYISLFQSNITLRWEPKEVNNKELELKNTILSYINIERNKFTSKLSKYETKVMQDELKILNAKTYLQKEELCMLDLLESKLLLNKGYIIYDCKRLSSDLKINQDELNSNIKKLVSLGVLQVHHGERLKYLLVAGNINTAYMLESDKIKCKVYSWILSQSNQKKDTFSKSDILQTNYDIEKLREKKDFLSISEKHLLDNLERNLFGNIGYVVYNSNYIALSIKENPVSVKTAIRSLIKEGKLEILRLNRTTFVIPKCSIPEKNYKDIDVNSLDI